MEISVSKMPQFLRQDVLRERKKLIEDGKVDENVQDIFHLFSEALQLRLLDFAEGMKKGQVHSSGDDFDLPEHREFEAPKDYKDKVEAVRIAFTSGVMGSRARVAETIEEASEAKNAWEKTVRDKSEEEVKRSKVVEAFTNRPIVKETK